MQCGLLNKPVILLFFALLVPPVYAADWVELLGRIDSVKRGMPLNRGGAIWHQKQGTFNLVEEITKQANRAGIPPERLAAHVWVESRGNPCATGAAGEVGLMQLMPGTAREMDVLDRYDPVQNLRGGADYLAYAYRLADGDWNKAGAIYNFGPKALSRRWPATTRDYVQVKIPTALKKIKGQGLNIFNESHSTNCDAL